MKFTQDMLAWPAREFAKLQQLGDAVQAVGGNVAEWNRDLQLFAFSEAASSLSLRR